MEMVPNIDGATVDLFYTAAATHFAPFIINSQNTSTSTDKLQNNQNMPKQ